MKNLESKKLTRSEMKTVLGGIGRVCITSADCPAGQSCVSGDYKLHLCKDEVPVTYASSKIK